LAARLSLIYKLILKNASKFAYECEQKNNGVKPVLRGHLLG